MADVPPQLLRFTDDVDRPTRFRVEAGHITAVLLQGQPAPLEDKFSRLAPRIEVWLRTGTFPAKQ